MRTWMGQRSGDTASSRWATDSKYWPEQAVTGRAVSREPGDCADPCAFTALYRENVTPIYRYLYLHTGNREDAEDLTGLVFSKALISWNSYKGQGTFAAWLFGIARHTLRDHQRRKRPLADLSQAIPAPIDRSPLPEDLAISAEQDTALHEAIRRLPPDQREALVLRYFSELRPAEIAQIQNRTVGAIRVRLHRALAALRALYPQGG